MKNKQLLATLLVIFCFAITTISTAHAATRVKLAHCTAQNSPYDIGALKFKELFEKATDGRYEVIIHAGDMTTDELELAEMVQAGSLQIGWIGVGPLSGFSKETMLFTLPFLFRDVDHLEKFIAGPTGQKFLDNISAVNGIVGLGYGEDGWRQITSKDRVINSLEDAKGMKIRIMQNDVIADLYKALDMVPVALPSGEIYTSIQTGMVEGQDNGPLFAKADGYLEVQNSIAMIDHFYSAGITIGSEKFLNTISPEDKALLIESVKEAGAYQRAWTQKAQTEILEEFKNSGDKTVTYPNDRAKWAAAVAPVYEKYYKLYPNWKELVEEIQAIK